MKIAVIGQSLFGQEVYKQLRKEGHEVVGVFTIPDKDGKADPLGECRTGHRKGCVWVAELKVPQECTWPLLYQAGMPGPGTKSPFITMEYGCICGCIASNFSEFSTQESLEYQLIYGAWKGLKRCGVF